MAIPRGKKSEPPRNVMMSFAVHGNVTVVMWKGARCHLFWVLHREGSIGGLG